MAAADAAADAPPPPPPGLCDAVLLAPLTEDTFLHNLHVRFKRDVIYTYVGNALVSVNPGRPLALYSAELVRAYLARPPHLLPPHLYGIAAAAYRWVRDRGESQCIVMTGESGAGKTEAARVCLQCLVLAGGGGGGAGAAGRALTAAGTLLEAFGNAATARNHNASRFGKLLDVDFDFRGEPVSGHITHYLLEKERVVGAPAGERNFHVLYQLLAGAEPALLKRLRLQRSWEHYRVLRAPPAAAERADTEHFAFTKAAMSALGFDAAACGGVLRVLAFLLKVGNLRFEPAHNIDGSLAARLHHAHEPELRDACALLGVCPAALAAALGAACEPEPGAACPDADGDAAPDPDPDDDGCGAWAAWRRDRLLAALYSRLFTWLVTAVNAALQAPAAAAGAGAGAGAGGGRRASLGLLDVYGLESLAANGLERLLINYAAERVQCAVGARALQRELDEYAREGLSCGQAELTLDMAAADLLDKGAESVLGALREVSVRAAGAMATVGEGAGAGADAALMQRLQRRRHPRLQTLPPDRFQIVHFGGPVVYSARGMVARNRDALCPRALRVLSRAGEPLVRALFPDGATAGAGVGAGGTASPRHGAATLSCRQRALVAALLRRLPAAPRLVRCLRADAQLRPHRFDHQLLRHQLRTQGIIEMALVRRAGWCESMSARDVLARYGLLSAGAGASERAAAASPAPAALAAADAPAPAVRAARHLLRAQPIPSAEFAYGRTKVFIRSPRTVWELEALRAGRVEALVRALQRAWRRHRARAARRRELAARRRAAAVIARAWRRRRARSGGGARQAAARVVWRAWGRHARRRYLATLAARLPARHASPACRAWPACAWPALLGATDALLRALHHRWRCRLYRRGVDQTARNRMREKVTCSVLFLGRKALYARSVPHPFVGDYVRLRASAAWRRGAGAAGAAADAYVVFADVVRKVRRGGAAAPALAVLSTRALLLLDARSLRLKRRVPAQRVYRLSLSPFADDLLAVHLRARRRRRRRAGGGRVGLGLGGRRAGRRRRLPVGLGGRARRLPLRRAPAPRRRPAAALLPRARARHQAVPGRAERLRRAARRRHRAAVRGAAGRAACDGALPRARAGRPAVRASRARSARRPRRARRARRPGRPGRARRARRVRHARRMRRAPRAPRQPPRRAAMTRLNAPVVAFTTRNAFDSRVLRLIGLVHSAFDYF